MPYETNFTVLVTAVSLLCIYRTKKKLTKSDLYANSRL